MITIDIDSPDREKATHWSMHARHFHDLGRGRFGFGKTRQEAVEMLERCIVDGLKAAVEEYEASLKSSFE